MNLVLRFSRICAAVAAIAALTLPAALEARVLRLDIDGPIAPITHDIVASAIAQAEHEHDDALLIRISTPGGLMDATREIVEEIFHSSVPVITWTGPSGARAASAGFFILEAGDVAAMAPGTNTGASHPVLATGGEMDSVMKSKVENDAAALMRTIVAHRERGFQPANQTAAEKAVRESASYTDGEALDRHLIDLVAANPDALLHELDGREIKRFDGHSQTLHFPSPSIEVYKPSMRQRVMTSIADPNIALLVLIIGALGIYLEFHAPGMVAPGVAGAILVLLGLTSLAMLPIDWLGAALMILGFIFFVLEAKFATHGVLTTGGAVALVLGAVMLVDTNVPELRIHWATAIGLALPFALITSWLVTIAVRARQNKVVTGAEGILGMEATTVSELNPSGEVLVRGEYWSARAARPVAAHEHVRVTGIDGLTLKVEAEKKEA